MRAFHARQGAWGGECAALGGAPATAASAGEATSLRSSIAAAVARRCARRQAEGRPNERRCIHLSRGTCAPGRRAERLLRAQFGVHYNIFYFSTKSVDSLLTEGFTLHLRGRGALERAPCPANCTPPLSGCLRHPE